MGRGNGGAIGRISTARPAITVSTWTAPRWLSATTSGTQIVTPTNNNFSAWYAQAQLDPHRREPRYNPATGALHAAQGRASLYWTGRLGRLGTGARYSDTDLNDNVLDPANVVTAGVGRFANL